MPLLWAGFIFVLSHQPRLGTPPISFEGIDKVAHAFVYGVLASLVFWAAPGGPMARARLSFALSALYGVSDEVHQMFVPGRSPDALDLCADALGAALVCAWALLRTRRKGYHLRS